jgi:hypothetical protein
MNPPFSVSANIEGERDRQVVEALDACVRLIDNVLEDTGRSDRARLYAIIRTQLQLTRGFAHYELKALEQ